MLENRILAERLETIIPAIMRAEGIDLWLLVAREYFEEPVVATMLDAENIARTAAHDPDLPRSGRGKAGRAADREPLWPWRTVRPGVEP